MFKNPLVVALCGSFQSINQCDLKTYDSVIWSEFERHNDKVELYFQYYSIQIAYTHYRNKSELECGIAS